MEAQTTLYDADGAFTANNGVIVKNFTATSGPLPRLFSMPFVQNAGMQLAVILKFIQSTTAGPNTITMAVDVVGRDS